ncbi:MAG: TadE/TadG family type IV pilus assembly protein [Pirellulaceae bacterium]
MSFLRRKSHTKRRAVAAAEAAFCIPLILILASGTLEISRMIFLKERLTVCAYEGCRSGVKRRSTADQVRATVNSMLPAFGITNATVTVTPNNFDALNKLDPIYVTIQVPYSGAARLYGSALSQTSMSSTVSMVREFDD